jgi:hypothetical protein
VFFIINNNIDAFSRFGTEPLKYFFPGQSRVAFRLGIVATGVSTEYNWWGPGF